MLTSRPPTAPPSLPHKRLRASLDFLSSRIPDPVNKLWFINRTLEVFDEKAQGVKRLPIVRGIVFHYVALESLGELVWSPKPTTVALPRGPLWALYRLRHVLLVVTFLAVGFGGYRIGLVGYEAAQSGADWLFAQLVPVPAAASTTALESYPDRLTVPPTNVWLVSNVGEVELWSNGLRVDTSFETPGNPRSFFAFPKTARRRSLSEAHPSESCTTRAKATWHRSLHRRRVRKPMELWSGHHYARTGPGCAQSHRHPASALSDRGRQLCPSRPRLGERREKARRLPRRLGEELPLRRSRVGRQVWARSREHDRVRVQLRRGSREPPRWRALARRWLRRARGAHPRPRRGRHARSLSGTDAPALSSERRPREVAPAAVRTRARTASCQRNQTAYWRNKTAVTGPNFSASGKWISIAICAHI